MARRYSPTADERQERKGARAEQLTKIHEQLCAGVAELVNGEATGRRLLVQGAWFLGAVWLQFFGTSPALNVAGLLLQLFLAIYLRLRATLDSMP